MIKKISLLICVFSLAISANAFASPYVQINAALSPSTTITNLDTDVKYEKYYDGLSYGVEAIAGTQGRLFAYEIGVAYTKNPTRGLIESSIMDYKFAALVAPKVGLGMMAIIPYIGPQIGYSSYSSSHSDNRGAFLYGAKAGIKLPLALLYVDLGASFLQRRGTFINDTSSHLASSLNVYLGLGFRLF